MQNERQYFADLSNPKLKDILYYFFIQSYNQSFATREIAERTNLLSKAKLTMGVLTMALIGSESLIFQSSEFKFKYPLMLVVLAITSAKIFLESRKVVSLEQKIQLNLNQLLAIEDDNQYLLSALTELDE